LELEMTDLEALVVAGYVFADEYPVPARCGRRPLVTDAELVALAVAQAAIGISSDREFLGLAGRVLPGWFPHLPDQSQYNRRLRGLVELISIVQQRLARCLDTGGVPLSDGTLIGVANYPSCAQRSEFAGSGSQTKSQASVAHRAMMRFAAAVAQVGGSYAACAIVRDRHPRALPLRRPQAPQPNSSCVASWCQKLASGSAVTPAAFIIGWISDSCSRKNDSKLCRSGHSSRTISLAPSSEP
jgi:hypothetical protein